MELRDDFAGGLLLFDLLIQKPLELDHGGIGLFPEHELVERLDLPAHRLLLFVGRLEDLGQRLVLAAGLLEIAQIQSRIPRQHEVKEPHRMIVFLLALQPEPAGRAGEAVLLAPGRHGQVGVRSPQLRMNLLVDGVLNGLAHHDRAPPFGVPSHPPVFDLYGCRW